MTYDPAECMVFALTGMTSKERKSVRAKAIKFPLKLMYVLECLDYQDVIAWDPDGTSFTIINPKAFELRVLPEIFKQAKFASFQRKLARWSFVRVGKVTSLCSYSHPQFVRGEWDLCSRLNSTDKEEALGFKETPPIASDLFLTRDKHISHLQLLHRRQAHMAAKEATKKSPSARVDESSGPITSATMMSTGLEIPSSTNASSELRGLNPSIHNRNVPPPASSSISSLINEVKSLESRQQYEKSLQDRLVLNMIREREMNANSTNPLLGMQSPTSSLPQIEQQMLENLLRNRSQSSAHPIMGTYAQSSAAMEHAALQAEKEALMNKLLHLSVMPSHITEARSLLSPEGRALSGRTLGSSLHSESPSAPFSLSGYNPSSLLQSEQGNHSLDTMQRVLGSGIANHLNDKAHIMKRAIEALDRPAPSDAMSSRLGQELAASINHSSLSRQTQASLEAQLLAQRMGHGQFHR